MVKTALITFRTTEEKKEELKKAAAEKGISMSNYIEKVLSDKNK